MNNFNRRCLTAFIGVALACATVAHGQSLTAKDVEAADAVVEVSVTAIAPAFGRTTGRFERQMTHYQNSMVSASVKRTLLGGLKSGDVLFRSNWASGEAVEDFKDDVRYFVALHLSGKPVGAITTNGKNGATTTKVFWQTVSTNSWEPVNSDSRKRIQKLVADLRTAKAAPKPK